jgi:hypothetical protein
MPIDAVVELTDLIARANESCDREDLYRWHYQRVKILQNRFAYGAAADACREALASFPKSEELQYVLDILIKRVEKANLFEQAEQVKKAA